MRLAFAIAWIALAASLPAAEEAPIAVGMPEARVTALRGKPLRAVQTESGTLLFYRGLLVGVEKGSVTFLSRVSEESQPETGGGQSSPPAAADPVQAQVVDVRKAPPLPPALPLPPPPTDWIEEGKEKQVQLAAERIRRCIAMDSYGKVLARVPWQDYYAGRHHSYAGNGAVADELARDGRRPAGDPAPDGVTFVDLRDAQSLAVPRHGEAFQHSERATARQSVSLGEATR